MHLADGAQPWVVLHYMQRPCASRYTPLLGGPFLPETLVGAPIYKLVGNNDGGQMAVNCALTDVRFASRDSKWHRLGPGTRYRLLRTAPVLTLIVITCHPMLQASFNHGGGLVGGRALSMAWMGQDFVYPDEGTGAVSNLGDYSRQGGNFIAPGIPVVCWGIEHHDISPGASQGHGYHANDWASQALRMAPGELYSEDHYLHDPSYGCGYSSQRTNRQVSRNSRFGGRRSLVGTGVLDIAISYGMACALIDPENNPHDTQRHRLL